MSIGCAMIALHCTALQSWHSQLTLYACNIPNAICSATPEVAQVMLEMCRLLMLNKLNEKYITMVSLY
jgi:hypothetical protein